MQLPLMAFGEVGLFGIPLEPLFVAYVVLLSSQQSTQASLTIQQSVITALRVPADEVDNPLMQRWWRRSPPTQPLAAR